MCRRSVDNCYDLIEQSQSNDFSASVIVPSDPEKKAVIDKLAAFVVKSGRVFETMTKDRNHDNPKFRYFVDCFLHPFVFVVSHSLTCLVSFLIRILPTTSTTFT